MKAVIDSMALKIEEHMLWQLKICKTRIHLSFKSWKKKRLAISNSDKMKIRKEFQEVFWVTSKRNMLMKVSI
jgi:hypothetical protein